MGENTKTVGLIALCTIALVATIATKSVVPLAIMVVFLGVIEIVFNSRVQKPTSKDDSPKEDQQ